MALTGEMNINDSFTILKQKSYIKANRDFERAARVARKGDNSA